MLVSDAGEEQLFEVLPIIFLVFAYPDDAILDDVGHNYFCFCSTFYSYSMRKGEMLHAERLFLAFSLFVDCF